MKSIIAIGLSLLIFSTTDNLAIKILTIIYLIISILTELYVLGDEKGK
jgi:hypothetical protein